MEFEYLWDNFFILDLCNVLGIGGEILQQSLGNAAGD